MMAGEKRSWWSNCDVPDGDEDVAAIGAGTTTKGAGTRPPGKHEPVEQWLAASFEKALRLQLDL